MSGAGSRESGPPGSGGGEGGASSAPARRPGLRRLLRFGGLALLALLLVMVVKALATPSRQIQVEPAEGVPVDAQKVAAHLARAITFRTVSHQDPAQNDRAAFLGLHAALQEMFPRAHQVLTREVVSDLSLLYTWKGKDASKPPILLMAHMDVVPVEPGTEGDWQKPPFDGVVEGGFVWGRGAMDFKLGVVGLLSAVEALVERGHAPSRSIYLAFGHDEEIGGLQGARAIAELLTSRRVHFAYVLDEGLVVTQGIIKGIDRPIALIGLAEKGYLSVELAVESQGGHSSMPPRPTAIGILSRALARLEDHSMPARLEGPTRLMFETVAPEMPFGQRLLLSNLWLVSPVVKSVLSAAPATDALLRTTTAPTILEGSVKENVLPKRPRAIVNFRILPGDTRETVLDHIKRAVADDRVEVRAIERDARDPSPVSDASRPGYRSLERTIHQIFPNTIVAPSLVPGGTDSRHYQPLADGVYRFSPQRMSPEDRARYHGTNERLSVENLAECVRFYAQLIRNGDSL
jgi:carboxypeptidase PM20D1